MMKRIESLKRLIILQLSFLGLLVHTGIYAFFWFEEYYPFLRFHGKANFFRNGHLLIILIYFVLLFFFASTYGVLKIGYLKPVDVFISEFFTAVCQCDLVFPDFADGKLGGKCQTHRKGHAHTDWFFDRVGVCM